MRRLILVALAFALLVLGLPAAFTAGGSTGSSTDPALAVGGRCVIRTAADSSDAGTDPRTDIPLDAGQMANARAVAAAAGQRQLPARAAAIALTAALAVSGLRTEHPDLTGPSNRGLFDVGPVLVPGVESATAAASIATFYTRLAAVPDYLLLPIPTAALRANPSPTPPPYGRWAAAGEALAAALSGHGSAAVSCTAGDIGTVRGAPEGARVARVLAAARSQLGVWYVWAGGNPDGPTTGAGDPCSARPDDHRCGFDCSGLVLYAFARVGVVLPHSSRSQYRAGRHVPLADARPGDLIFLATDTADPGTIHHVAMVDGPGRIVEAQQTGVPLHVRAYQGVREPEIMSEAVRLVG